MYSVCRAPVVKRIIISTRKERREKKTRNKHGLVVLVNARKPKELLIILQTAANQLEAASSPWKTQRRGGKKGCLVQLSAAVWKMLTLEERKSMVLQTESYFPFTQITYIFQNVNSSAFPLRVQLSGGCFAMGGLSFFLSSPECANLEATALALGTKSDFKAAGALAASRAVNHPVLLGKGGTLCCPPGIPAGSIPPGAHTSYRNTDRRVAGFTPEHPSAKHRGGDNPARPSESGHTRSGSPGWWHFCPKIQRRWLCMSHPKEAEALA